MQENLWSNILQTSKSLYRKALFRITPKKSPFVTINWINYVLQSVKFYLRTLYLMKCANVWYIFKKFFWKKSKVVCVFTRHIMLGLKYTLKIRRKEWLRKKRTPFVRTISFLNPSVGLDNIRLICSTRIWMLAS